jgi:hypothetical protein
VSEHPTSAIDLCVCARACSVGRLEF